MPQSAWKQHRTKLLGGVLAVLLVVLFVVAVRNGVIGTDTRVSEEEAAVSGTLRDANQLKKIQQMLDEIQEFQLVRIPGVPPSSEVGRDNPFAAPSEEESETGTTTQSRREQVTPIQ